MTKLEKVLIVALFTSAGANLFLAFAGYQLLREPEGMRFFLLFSAIATLVFAVIVFFAYNQLPLKRRVFCSIGCLPIFAVYLWAFNIFADISEPITTAFKIQQKGIKTSHNKGTKYNYYYLWISFDGTLTYVNVPKSDFDRAEPNKSKIVMTLYRGALGQAWYQGYQLVTNDL